MDVGPTQRSHEVGVIMGFRKLKLCLKTACKLLLHGRGGCTKLIINQVLIRSCCLPKEFITYPHVHDNGLDWYDMDISRVLYYGGTTVGVKLKLCILFQHGVLFSFTINNLIVYQIFKLFQLQSTSFIHGHNSTIK